MISSSKVELTIMKPVNSSIPIRVTSLPVMFRWRRCTDMELYAYLFPRSQPINISPLSLIEFPVRSKTQSLQLAKTAPDSRNKVQEIRFLEICSPQREVFWSNPQQTLLNPLSEMLDPFRFSMCNVETLLNSFEKCLSPSAPSLFLWSPSWEDRSRSTRWQLVLKLDRIIWQDSEFMLVDTSDNLARWESLIIFPIVLKHSRSRQLLSRTRLITLSPLQTNFLITNKDSFAMPEFAHSNFFKLNPSCMRIIKAFSVLALDYMFMSFILALNRSWRNVYGESKYRLLFTLLIRVRDCLKIDDFSLDLELEREQKLTVVRREGRATGSIPVGRALRPARDMLKGSLLSVLLSEQCVELLTKLVPPKKSLISRFSLYSIWERCILTRADQVQFRSGLILC